MSGAVEQLNSMTLVWMPMFDLVWMRGDRPGISIGGRPVMTGRIPAPRLHRRRLINYAADLTVVQLNPAHDGPLARNPR